ncbi:unnamed protein product [Symbiodinium sp. CCMP2456]|nr:unnamed protein product [Symbiodinium sp. CCMP2456]
MVPSIWTSLVCLLSFSYAEPDVLSSQQLRIGPGTKSSLRKDGGLQQPFYRSANGWTKLTYDEDPLELAFKVDGRTARIGGASRTFYNSTYAEVSSNLMVDDVPRVSLKRIFSFPAESVFRSEFRLTALSSLSGVQLWMGTSDDWIGTTDEPTKEQGEFRMGSFASAAHGNVLHVFSGEEDVFFFSTHPESRAIILAHYGHWSDVVGVTASELHSSQSDGAYGIYVPVGPFAHGEAKSVSIYFAAAAGQRLTELLHETEAARDKDITTTSTTTTTTAAPLVLQTPALRLAFLPGGGLGQPFYMSSRRGWTKLTYNNQNLDCSVKVNGHLTDMGGNVALDFKNASYARASGALSLSGTPQVQLTRTYSFLGNGRVLKAHFQVVALQGVSNVQVWMGTSDDWIGTSDRPTKVQGVFRGGEFVPTPHGRILRVHSGEEDVFVYSTHPDSHAIILSHYGQWDDVLAATQSDLHSSTSDGAYGIYVPLGRMAAGESKSASVYYAAADADRLAELLRDASVAAHEDDTTTTTSTTPPPVAHILKSSTLQFALLEEGGLGGPLYRSELMGWTKLTYNHQNLDCTVKVNGRVVDYSSDPREVFFSNSSYATSISRLKLDGSEVAVLTRVYSFLEDGLVFRAQFTAVALAEISSLEVWMGTSNDWLGSTDRPTKEQGAFHGDVFTPVPQACILRVRSREETLFFFSNHPDSHALIVEQPARWQDVYALTSSSTEASVADGAYGIYVPFGKFGLGETKSASFFYGATEADRLVDLMPATARVFRTYPMMPSRSNLLVQDYEQCTEGSANSSVDCTKADFCWNHMAVVHSNCRVLYVSTMSISELKKYICGKSTCAAAARIAQRKCGRTYAIDTSWLAPVFFYYDRYCSDEFHVTDLVNDQSSCELSLLDRLHGFCERVMNCYTEAGAFARNCRLDQATMQEVQTVVESKGCADAAEHVLDLCGDYDSVRRTTTAMKQYRRFFQQSGVAALPSPPGLTPWPTNTSHFLTPAYERCTMTTDITERNSEECSKAVHCHSLLSAATTACDVIWLPSIGVSSLADHVCGRSLCGSFAVRVEAECGHFHRARSVFGPVMSYRRKYCPDLGHTDMINDLFVCRLTPKNSSTRPHCAPQRHSGLSAVSTDLKVCRFDYEHQR